MNLGWFIAGTYEEIRAFLSGQGFEGLCDRITYAIEGTLLGFTQVMLELGEELLDRIEIGGVFRQEEELCARGPDRLADGAAFVRAQVVHHDDIAGR